VPACLQKYFYQIPNYLLDKWENMPYTTDMTLVVVTESRTYRREEGMITYEQALTASRFTFESARKPGKICECRRNGKTQTWKTWKTRPGHFKIPVKYGLYEYSYITHENAADFTVKGTE
jgi:hypothetical protein